MSSHITSSSERAVMRTDRRALLQMALLAPFAASHRASAAGAQSAALDPILTVATQSNGKTNEHKQVEAGLDGTSSISCRSSSSKAYTVVSAGTRI